MTPESSSTVDCGRDVSRAVRVLRSGGLVALPTETVYGLGADAHDPDAVARVFAAKGRPVGHPLIVHVGSRRKARQWASDWPDVAEALARRYWPGPLTIVVKRASHVPDAVTGGRDTVALRVPSHRVMRRVLRRFGDGIAAPSANKFGAVSPTTAEHVVRDLGPLVDYVLDGGSCEVGLESTIVDCTVNPPQILRPGAVTEQMVAAVVDGVAPASGPSRASGMLASHYAPRCRVVAFDDEADAIAHIDGLGDARVRLLDARTDPRRFARRLYGELRRCDDDGIDVAVVVLPDAHGLGAAIRDRVTKASADRPPREHSDGTS